MMMLVLLGLLLPTLLFLLHHRLFVAAKLPPGPTLWQLWRKRSLFATKPHVALNELAQIHGPLMSIRVGAQLIVVASSPATVEEIHKTNNLIFSGRYMPAKYYNVPGAGDACITMARECDASWRLLRGVAQKFMFSGQAVESFAAIRRAKVADMIRLVKVGRGVDVERAMYAAFNNIITTIIASTDLFEGGGVGERDEKVVEFMEKIVTMVTLPGFEDLFPVLGAIDFWSKKKSLDIYDNVKLMWGDIIKQRRDQHLHNINNHDDHPKPDKDFLDVLMGYAYDDDQLACILMELLLGGTDSTSVTGVWLMAELVRNEQVLRKVRQELEDHAIVGGILEESRLSECSYFQACIKEALRVRIPGPFGVPHRATKSCVISKYTIPKDSIVVVNAWAIHLDPNVWEDAASFRPERFLESRINFKGADFEFIPFSSGNRMCPGYTMALKAIQLMVASLVYHFDWTLPNGGNPTQLDMADKYGTSLKLLKPLLLIPTLRQG